jgi:hypothetical protein
MKINQADSIKLFKLFQGQDDKIKSLSDKDRRVLVTALLHIEKKQFDDNSDAYVGALITRLNHGFPEKHISSKVDSFIKGFKNIFLLRIDSSMIKGKIASIENKKMQVEDKFKELDSAITDHEIWIHENKEAITYASEQIPILQEAHNFFATNYLKFQGADKGQASKHLDTQYIQIKEKRIKQFTENDIDNLTPAEKKDLANNNAQFKPLCDFAHSMKKLMEFMEKNPKVYIKEIQAQIQNYKENLNGVKELISNTKKETIALEKKRTDLQTELGKVSADKEFYKSLFEEKNPIWG